MNEELLRIIVDHADKFLAIAELQRAEGNIQCAQQIEAAAISLWKHAVEHKNEFKPRD